MKTLTLEIDEESYPSLMAFLRRLPADRYALYEDEEPLSESEQAELDRIRAKLAAGDDSEFENWTDLRNNL